MLHPPKVILMRLAATLATLLVGLAPLPALASSCAEQIGTIEVTGLQEGQVVRTGSLRGLTTVRLDDPSDPEIVSTADHVAIAKTLIIRAADEDRRGDKRACENTMSEAKGMIGALP